MSKVCGKSLKLVPCCCTDETHGKAVVDKVMTSVKGGTLPAAVAMKAKLDKEGVMDIATFQTWAQTITEEPALIHSEVGMTHWQSEAVTTSL